MFIPLKNPFRPIHFILLGILMLALVVGAAMPIYAGLMGDQVAKLAAFPALLMFGLLFLFDRKILLMLIIFFRAAGDNLLELTRFSLGGYPIGVGGLINAAVILIALMLALSKPKEAPKGLLLTWAAFLLIALFGVALSPVKSEAIRSWLALVSYFAIFVSAFHFVKTKEDFRFCAKLVIWSSVLPVLYSFVDVALNHGAGGPEGFRLRSTFNHPNVYAFYLTVIIPVAFYTLKSMPVARNGAARFFLGCYIFVLIGMLVLTKTRSAWMACLLCFVLYALFFERRYFAYLLVLGVVGLFIPGVADRLADLGQGNQVSTYAHLNSFAWRVFIWESAFHWTKPIHYFFGNGYQSFKEYSIIFFPSAGHLKWGAHSVYVQLLFELGVVGVGSFLFVFYKVFAELTRMLKIDRLGAFFLIVVMFNFLVCAFSDNLLDYLSFNWYLWFMAGVGCALVRSGAPVPAAPAAMPAVYP